MDTRMKVIYPVLSALALALALQGCSGGGGGEDKIAVASSFVVNTPQTLAQESADNYDENVNGLVTGATLKRWKDNWTTERAKLGLTGKLIILQATVGPKDAEYIKPNGSNVVTYLSPSSEWIQTRDNGVIETQSMVPNGAAMDGLLKKYNIDPVNDMIVVAMGTGSFPNAMGQGRIWYALRYWGFDKKNLALVNGGNQWLNGTSMTAADFQATPNVAPDNGFHSVKSLKVDNTQLQATVEDMIRVLTPTDTNNKGDGVLIWDARSMAQYSAGEKLELGEDTNTDVAGTQACASAYCNPVNSAVYQQFFQNGGSRQGHPNGTLQLQYTHLMDATKGYVYRPKSELLHMLQGGVNAAGVGFVDGSYGLVGSGNGYQNGDVIYNYCETTFRAMITGVAAAVILGKPVRFYDGAMVEWNSLTYATDKNGKTILPADSPWRTDVKSFYRPASSNTLVDPRTITNAYATSTNKIVNEDKAYKTGESASAGGGAGGGGGAPSNPCGG